jgi:hypothetical protein
MTTSRGDRRGFLDLWGCRSTDGDRLTVGEGSPGWNVMSGGRAGSGPPVGPCDFGDLKVGGGEHGRNFAGEVGSHVLPTVEQTADAEQHPRKPGRGSTEVDEQKPAAGREDPPNFSDGGDFHRVGQVMENQRADNKIEGAIGKRQVLGVALNQLQPTWCQLKAVRNLAASYQLQRRPVGFGLTLDWGHGWRGAPPEARRVTVA